MADYKWIKKAAGIMGTLMLALSFWGCGPKMQEILPLQDPGTVDTEDFIENAAEPCPYFFDVISLPDSNKDLAVTLPENCSLSDSIGGGKEGLFEYQDGVVYKSCTVIGKANPEDEYYSDLARYVQVLEPPYETWQNIPLHCEEYMLEKIRLSENGRILCLGMHWENQVLKYDAIELKRDGTEELVQTDISKQELEETWKVSDTGGSGINSNFYTIAKAYDICVDKDKDGMEYFATSRKLWQYDGTDATELLDLRKQNLALQTLRSMKVTDSGFMFFGSFSGKNYLIKATKTDTPQMTQKKELVYADTYGSEEIMDAIADFNMQSREYRIVVKKAGMEASDEKIKQFCDSIQKEILQGKGPDILSDSVMDNISAYARNGYLLQMDDFFQGKEDLFWPGALEAGVIDGKRYGIPCGMMLSYLVGNEELLPEKDSWNARELMDCVRSSGAQRAFYAVWTREPYQEALNILLMDEEDPTYIDWKNGISHLNEQPFLEVLEFVKEYVCQEPDFDEVGAWLGSGQCALFDSCYKDNTILLRQSAIYKNHAKIIGYPSVSGRGVSMTMESLYAGANTENKEGVYQFFEYLLSDQGQMNCFSVEYPNWLPIRKDTYLWMVETGGNNITNRGGVGTYSHMGVDYEARRLSPEEKQQAIFLAEHCKPYSQEFLQIRRILSEETEGYFQGQRSAEDTMEILHNRVQLYFNEK